MPNRCDHLHITTKQIAILIGLKRYFTGKKCKSGHLSIRYINGRCAACAEISAKEWHAKNPEKIKKAKRDYLEKNRSKHYQSVDRWQAANKDRLRSYVSEWGKRNPEKRRIHNQNRRAMTRSSGGSFSAGDLFLILLSQNGLCSACGIDILDCYQIDHVVPISKGGSGNPSNLQCLCPGCNASKGSKNYEEWLSEKRGKKIC